MAGLNWKEIIEKAGLTPEQKLEAEKVFGTESLTKLVEESALHAADEAFKADRETLQKNWDKANAEYIAMQDKVENSEATAKELAQAKKDLAEAGEKLKAANPNIDLEKLQNDIVTRVKSEVATVELGARGMELDALDCVEEHTHLFGNRISTSQLVKDALAAKKPVQAYWNEKYGVQAKREEIAKATHDKEIADATEAGYKKALSEREHPGMRTLAPSKDPFWVPKPDGKEATQPWDAEGAPSEEQALLQELSAARG
jgi:hypothetical protein